MKPVEIKNGIFWVGVQNPDLRIFDVIMETRWGTSYNTYIVKGSEKTALIDSVKNGFLEAQLAYMEQICDPSKIDYIVMNHTEPDHSGSLEKMLDIARNAVVVCSRAAKTLIKELINRDFECMVVSDGDTIDLGGKTLSFISAPYLHWPDSMFTYVKEDKFLSTCDAFGFHFSSPEVFDDLTPLSEEMVESQKYYYDVIMSPFKSYVLQAIEKIRGLDVDVIAPSHGPVLRSDPWAAVKRYEEWSRPLANDPKEIYICYVSCYGYTEKLAREVAKGAKTLGHKVVTEEITGAGPACVAGKCMEADAFAIGSPTLNRDALPPVWEVLSGLCSYVVKGKNAALFGSYGWSGEACKFMEQRLTDLGAKPIGSARAKMNPSGEELKQAYELGVSLAETVK